MMWSDILRKLFGPSYVPLKIRMLLQYRFASACILGFWLEYNILAIFLGFQLFEVRRPLSSVRTILGWTLFSAYSTIMMALIQAGVAGYGFILCHLHYAYPRCYGSRMKRITQEFPIRFLMLCSILAITIVSSCLYASFVASVKGCSKPGATWDYLLILGCVSGIFYFKTQHGSALRRFPLPVVRLGLQESILQMWWSLLKRSGKEACVPTILVSMILWPYMEGPFNGVKVLITEPGLLFRGWLLSSLVLAKLHMVRGLYGLIMQSQLTLNIELRCQDEPQDICLQNLFVEWIKYMICSMKRKPFAEKKTHFSLSLPISMALDGTQLYGFRMLAARDFYAEMSGSLWTELFAVKDMMNTNAHWEELREVLYKIINDFLVKMDSCLDTAPQAQICDLLKRQKGIRSLSMSPKPPQRTRACPRSCENHTHEWCICYLGPYLKKRIALFLGDIFKGLPELPNFFGCLFEIDKLAKLNYTLQCGEPLVWILQGLVCICVRSIKEDSFGLVQRDLSGVFETLVKVEEKLVAAAEVPVQTVDGNRKLCSSHKLLMLATNRCLFKMLKTFGPHLDFIVNNETLREKLQCRMENLNVFQEIF